MNSKCFVCLATAVACLFLPLLVTSAETYAYYAYQPVSVYNIDENVTKTENIHAATIYLHIGLTTSNIYLNGKRTKIYKSASLNGATCARGAAGVPDSIGCSAGNLSSTYNSTTHQLTIHCSGSTLYGRSYRSAAKQNDSVNPNGYTYSSNFNNFTKSNITLDKTYYPVVVK
jgi:hypothetical protein